MQQKKYGIFNSKKMDTQKKSTLLVPFKFQEKNRHLIDKIFKVRQPNIFGQFHNQMATVLVERVD